MRLAGKRALITGAGSGIGRALALEASRRGMVVALIGRQAEKLQLTRAQMAAPSDCILIPGDVTLSETRQALRRRLADEWGSLDILVNNAGLIFGGPLALMRDAELEQLIAVNLTAPAALTRELLPLLRAAQPSRIVNVGSVLGEIAFPAFAAYSASKFGLRGLSIALRRELKALGIGVTYAALRGAQTAATAAIADIVEPLEMSLDPVDEIARDIWNVVAAGKDDLPPRGRERLFRLVDRLWPALVDRAIATQLKRSGVQHIVEGAMAASDGARLSRSPKARRSDRPAPAAPESGGI